MVKTKDQISRREAVAEKAKQAAQRAKERSGQAERERKAAIEVKKKKFATHNLKKERLSLLEMCESVSLRAVWFHGGSGPRQRRKPRRKKQPRHSRRLPFG